MGIEMSRLHLRRSIFIRATPERVWKEFESFERLDGWFGRGHRLEKYEPRLGARVELSVEIDGGRQRYGGEVIVLEEAGEVTWTNNWMDSDQAWPVPTFLTIRLTGLYEGTLVELFHHGFERLGADAADNLEGFEEGWDLKHLSALREIVEA